MVLLKLRRHVFSIVQKSRYTSQDDDDEDFVVKTSRRCSSRKAKGVRSRSQDVTSDDDDETDELSHDDEFVEASTFVI